MESSQFRTQYLSRLFENSFSFHTDNWPCYRFGDSEYGKEHKQGHIRFMEFVFENLENHALALSLFEDNTSREIYQELLQYKSLGPLHVKLRTHDEGYISHLQRMDIDPIGMTLLEKAIVDTGRWPLDLYQLDEHGFKVISTPAFALMHFYFCQYYFSRGSVSIAPVPGDVVLDCGSCWGDTALLFAKTVGEKGHVHGFEFVADNVAVFQKNKSLNPDMIDNISLCSYALSDISGEQLFYSCAGPGTHVRTQGESVTTSTTIDEYVHSKQLDAVDFIKMDIEGFEKKALLGAERTIKTFKPKLAISAYHLPKDMFDLPQTIKQKFPWYKLYLDHHTTYGEETVIYAIAGENSVPGKKNDKNYPIRRRKNR